MRPQYLRLKNFMPFRSSDGHTHEVDFSNLDLFAITGPMGSGKSSLIDAVVWCLYGRTARYSSDSKGVVSTGESACEVAFDFTVGEQRFRAVRRTGLTTESGLSELEGEEWVQDTSGAEQLTKRIEALLGLDFAGFTKTVILPQGSYAEFLCSEPNKRRDLLAKILELGVYARVADRAKEVAGQAKTRADTIRETLAQYAGVSRELMEQRRQEWEAVGKQLAEAGAQESVLRGLVQKAEVVTTSLSRLSGLQAEERSRVDEKERARQRRDEAHTSELSLAQKVVQALAEREALGYDASRHAVVKRAVVHLYAYDTARQEAERKGQDLTHVQHELDALTRQIVDQEQNVAAARCAHQERAATLQAELAASGDIASLTEQIRDAKRWKELRREHTQLTERHETITQQRTGVQQSLALLVQQETAKEAECRELTQQRDRARADEQEKVRLEIEAGHLGKEWQEAEHEEHRAVAEADAARAALHAAEQEVQKQQHTLAWAEQQEQDAVHTLEEKRRQHEAEHLRTALRVGDPCPVCRTPVRELPPPSPEAKDDLSALQRTVAAARATLTQTRQALQQTSAAAARMRKETAERGLAEREQKRREAQERFLSRVPGFSSLSAALSALQAQRQEITDLVKEVEAKAQVAEKEKQALSQQREKTQRQEATVTEALRGVAVSLETGTAQLARLAQSLAPYLSDQSDPEMVLVARRQAVMQVQEEVKALEQQHRQTADALSSLNTRKVQKEGDFRVLASQRDAAVVRTEREAQTVRESLTLAAAARLPDLAALESEQEELARKQEQHAALLQREETLRAEQAKAERQTAELRADLQARERVLNETQQKRAQAEQEMELARAELRAAVVHSGLSDVGSDGEGVKERLTAVGEQVILLRGQYSGLAKDVALLEQRCTEKEQAEEKLRAAEIEGRLATDLHRLLGAEFTDFLSQGAVEALMRDATVHLQRLTHDRYSFDIAYKRRAIELQIVDHEDHQRARPTHSLSGGETFLASLAIALALSQGFREVATGKAAKTSTECLILDEGFGTLDREGLQLVTETLQELRGEEGRVVGIVTHVEEVAAAMPMRIEVCKGSRTSTIMVSG